MAIGNPSSNGTKKVESPIKGFAVHTLQVYTKDDSGEFKIERNFILNEPNENMFDTEEEFDKAVADHRKLVSKYTKFIGKCALSPTDKDNAHYLKQNERAETRLNAGELAYVAFPADPATVDRIDGIIYNMSQKLDVISSKQKTEKIYFDMVDFENKEIYRINSSMSKTARNWLDCMLTLDNFTEKYQFKFEPEMDSSKDFKEPRMKDGKQVIASVMMKDFRDGYYRKKVKPLYYNYKVETDKKGKITRTHECAEKDALEYHNALQEAIENQYNGNIIKFFIGKVNNNLIPTIQKEMTALFKEKGYAVEYMKNEKTGLFQPSFKKLEETAPEAPASTGKSDEDLPF
jgi:hypothetical protein